MSASAMPEPWTRSDQAVDATSARYSSKPVRVVLDELAVEHGRVLLRRLEDRFGDAAQQSHVAADPHLHVHGPDLGRVEGRHVDELVRDDRSPRSCFDQRVDVNELRAAPVGLGEPGKHPRSVRGGVVAHQPDRVRALPVVQVDGALAGSDRRRHRPAARLVAHVRAVRQVVRAKLAHPELVEKRRLVAQPPGGIKGRLMRTLQSTKRVADERESVFPGDRLVLVGLGVVAQRLGEPPYCLEVVVAPPRQLANGVGSEELAVGFRWLQAPRSTCLMPFSQMSSFRPDGSSAHAQPGQSKPPSSWFITKIARKPSIGSPARARTLATLRLRPTQRQDDGMDAASSRRQRQVRDRARARRESRRASTAPRRILGSMNRS